MTDRPTTGPTFKRQVPEGDNRRRNVCETCGFIDYENPKIVVGSVVVEDGRILLCRRSIEPRRGFWTIPAGFLEEHETTEDGARREAFEEARADLRIDTLLAVYNLPQISQVQLIYRARLATPEFAPGEESFEVDLFDWDDIPWHEIAFPTVHWALHHHRAVEHRTSFPPFGNPEDASSDL